MLLVIIMLKLVIALVLAIFIYPFLFVHSRKHRNVHKAVVAAVAAAACRFQLSETSLWQIHVQWTFTSPRESTSLLSLSLYVCVHVYLLVISYRFSMLLLLCNWNCTKRFCQQSTIVGYEWVKNNNGNELRDMRKGKNLALGWCALWNEKIEKVRSRKSENEARWRKYKMNKIPDLAYKYILIGPFNIQQHYYYFGKFFICVRTEFNRPFDP